jgi:hypothetical protein
VPQENNVENKLRMLTTAAKKILAKMKGSRPSEATLAELIAGEFEELSGYDVTL